MGNRERIWKGRFWGRGGDSLSGIFRFGCMIGIVVDRCPDYY
jgi:hypothetical protein